MSDYIYRVIPANPEKPFEDAPGHHHAISVTPDAGLVLTGEHVCVECGEQFMIPAASADAADIDLSRFECGYQ